VTWLTLAFSSGASVALITDVLPPAASWVRPVLALIATGLSLWLLVAQNQRNGLDCADLHFCWNCLANQYETLWDRMYSVHSAAVLKNLADKTAELSKSSTAFPNYPTLMAKWQDDVVAQHAAAA